MDAIPSFWEYIWLRKGMAALSYLMLLFCFFALTVIVRKIAISALIMSAVVETAGIANYFKLLYRKSPVVPLDVLQIGDALAVTREDMQISLTREMWIMLVFFLVVVLLLWAVRLPDFFTRGKISRRLLVGVLSVMFCFVSGTLLLTRVIQNETLMVSWGYKGGANTEENSYYSTFLTNFLYMTRFLKAEAPDGYSQQAMAEIKEDIDKYDTSQAQRPDIILVVAESWHMLDEYDITLTEDPFGNYRRLAQQGASGEIFSPYYGGGTANVEFELLTGLSASVVNLSSTMFNTSIYTGFPGVPNTCRELGYSTIALHAHTSTLYNRISAYTDLGFETLCFSDSFEKTSYSGEYINDQSCIEQAIALYEKAVQEEQKPVFMHVLTMEGHLFYDSDRIADSDYPIMASGEGYSAEQLGSLSAAATIYGDTDRAIGMLADYLAQSDRDAVLIVVGDHQSPISGETAESVVPDPQSDLLSRRVTPYLVWTNYECDLPQTFGTIPHNMLLPNALSALNVTRPPLFDYLVDSCTEINGIDSGYVLDTQGQLCETLTDEQQKQADLLELIRYDLVNGKRYLSQTA